MDLTKIKLPDAVEVSGVFYPIHTGHTYWFRFMQICKDKEATIGDFDYIYIGEPPEDRRAGLQELLKFAWEKKDIPRSDGEESHTRIIDYDIDSDLIWAAVLQCYGVDLAKEEVHWHKVRAMLAALPGTRLEEVMGWRCYTGKDVHLQRLQRMWALPEIVDEESEKNLEEFNALFGD